MQRCVLKLRMSLGKAMLTLLLWLLAMVFTSSAEASVKRVWAVDDSEKVKKEDLSNPLATSPDNPVWDGSQITLFGAKNEIIAFQVIIEADAAGATQVNVKLDALSGNGFVIRNTGTNDPFDYRGKRIEFFTVLYWKLIDYTTRGRWAVEAAPPPYYQSGWLPVASIPFQAPQGLGGAPFSIEPNMNQAVWVDIFIPKDAVAGRYTGNLVVTSNGAIVKEIPVVLDVYNFALSDVTHFKNFAWALRSTWSTKHGVAYDSSAHRTIEGRYMQMAHRHRLDLSLNGNLDWMESYYKQYLTGSYYTANHAYEGPGENVGNGTYGIGIYDQSQNRDNYSGTISGFRPDDQTGWRNASDAWVTWFSQNAPTVEYFKYMRDEPYMVCKTYPEIWQVIRDRADWVHNNPGVGKSLPILVTCPISYPELDGYIDYWMSTDWNYDLVKAGAERAKGNKCGYYNGRRPFFGTGMCTFDVEAADARVIPWIAWRYGVDQYFCWYVNAYAGKNPFQNIPANGWAVGDGIVILPGKQKDFPAYDLKLPGPVATLSLKSWRRGQQDYEYLWLAEQKGLHNKVNAIVAAIVPRALSDAVAHKPPTWPLRGAQFEDCRKQLAVLLADPSPLHHGNRKILFSSWYEKIGCLVASSSITDYTASGAACLVDSHNESMANYHKPMDIY
jgi:hypothetical protein